VIVALLGLTFEIAGEPSLFVLFSSPPDWRLHMAKAEQNYRDDKTLENSRTTGRKEPGTKVEYSSGAIVPGGRTLCPLKHTIHRFVLPQLSHPL
jgi:hypothetical protein